MSKKIPYVCGPLTEIPYDLVERVKNFYTKIGDLFDDLIGERAFVPHEHFDPVEQAQFSPREVDEAERRQVCSKTSILIVVAITPSWGGGIEVEMANQNNVPVIILKPSSKKVSRLLLGNPAVKEVIEFDYFDDAIGKLQQFLKREKIKSVTDEVLRRM